MKTLMTWLSASIGRVKGEWEDFGLLLIYIKSKKILKPRGSLKDTDYEMEGSSLEKGYEADTQDEA